MADILGIDLTKWFHDSVTETLGFSIATVSAEPVHILNGFLASCIKGPRAPDLVRQMVVTKGKAWLAPSDQLVEEARSASRPVKLDGGPQNIEVLRSLLRELLASDRAVFPTSQSYQVAHPGFITNDWTGADIGKQCASLLLGMPGGATSVSSLIDHLCRPQPNPLWALQSVFVGPLDPAEFSVGTQNSIPWDKNDGTAKLASHLGALLHRCVSLSATSVDSLSGLRVLANACEFVAALVYAQVPTLLRGSQHLVPLLVAVSDEAPTVRDVSARVSLPAVHGAMDSWIAQMLEGEVADRLGVAAMDRVAVEGFLRATLPYSRGAKGVRMSRSNTMIESAPSMLSQLAAGHGHASLAYPAALVLADLLRTTMAQDYDGWFDHHARRSGFLGPRRGRSPKRLCVEAPLVTTLVLAGLEAGEPSTSYREWLERLESRFGILVGPGTVTRTMIPRASEADLESNHDALATLLGRVGLARAYSDNTVEVLNPLPGGSER